MDYGLSEICDNDCGDNDSTKHEGSSAMSCHCDCCITNVLIHVNFTFLKVQSADVTIRQSKPYSNLCLAIFQNEVLAPPRVV